MGNHGYLTESEYVGTQPIKGNYSMVSLTGFPGVIEHEGGNTDIIVELYAVDDSTLRSLNALEGYSGPDRNNFYDRVTVETEFGDAFMYTLTEEYLSRPLVESGDWVKYNS
jgi:gamma-glutamylcyclotransferase (GGCT)/AIG2-like uncharacterized protein YtfP